MFTAFFFVAMKPRDVYSKNLEKSLFLVDIRPAFFQLKRLYSGTCKTDFKTRS